MAGKFSNSWEMIKASASVLKSDKELLLFPVFSSIAVILVTLSFALPLFVFGGPDPNSDRLFGMFNLPILFTYYFIIYFIIIYMNSALVGAATIRLKGGDPTVGDGFRIASENITSILGYALISSTIGILLKWAQERLGLLGKIFAFISNMAWNIVTFLVVPILVNEGIGPVEAIKRSTALLKKTWGEQLIGNIGIGMVFGFITLAVLLVTVPLAIFSAASGVWVIPILLGIISLVAILLIAVIGSTLNTIYTAALYRYAADGTVSFNFTENMLRESFRQK